MENFSIVIIYNYSIFVYRMYLSAEKILRLALPELKLVICLTRHLDERNEYNLNAKVKADVSALTGYTDQTIRSANSKLVRRGVVFRVRNGWYRMNPEVVNKTEVTIFSKN